MASSNTSDSDYVSLQEEEEISSRAHSRASPPTSLEAPISPPPSTRSLKRRKTQQDDPSSPPNLAAIEAGQARIDGHLSVFSEQLSRHVRPCAAGQGDLLSIDEFKGLYRRNQHQHGRHFVVHQHDHPVAGVHYDLRLQISESSSISFAVMYGLPGNPNSRRLNRNATETRVHNLWNHLIETASPQTGSLLIWDTGEYSILPYHTTSSPQTPSSSSPSSHETEPPPQSPKLSESEKLHLAFQTLKIRLRLHGHRLPQSYTLSLRVLPSNYHSSQPAASRRKRRRTDPSHPSPSRSSRHSTPESEPADDVPARMPQVAEEEDEQIRFTNAYPGAENSIGSIYQRRWFLSLDRKRSGFSVVTNAEGSKAWKTVCADDDYGRERQGASDDSGFVVLGRDVERSIVTGRTAEEVMRDEGVEGFVGRKGWRAVVE